MAMPSEKITGSHAAMGGDTTVDRPDDEGPAALQSFKALFNDLSVDNMHQLRTVYTDDVIFIDPFHEVNGLAALEKYMTDMYSTLTSSRFEYLSDVVQSHQAAVTWMLYYSHPKMRGGDEIAVSGCSVLEFRGDLVSSHRDFFDAGEMLYEHVPALGWAVRKIRDRM